MRLPNAARLPAFAFADLRDRGRVFSLRVVELFLLGGAAIAAA